MGCPSILLLTDFTEAQITEEFDEDVSNKTMEMDDSKEALVATKSLKRRSWMGIQATALTKFQNERFTVPNVEDHLKWKEEGNVFGRAARGTRRSNEQVKQDEQLIRNDELNVVKVQLASMYKEIAEGRTESKATLGKIYDAWQWTGAMMEEL
ncbi:hypothetical protein Cgig2_024273 [Carnegiea gigantea]|uniref:Uncharacterized protein n=1 Tax=Carnegiea gigantea TaxID=171969 RepID=A0A9Q1JVU4_9CARY|nr:hypothetical protein Cgig2_024273 [Carnegiea gigantea]